MGFVELSRARTRESLEHVLCGECPACLGTGSLKTVETVSYEIFREIIRLNRGYDADEFLVYCSPAVYGSLTGEESHLLAELGAYIGKRVRLQNEPMYAQNKFDVVIM